MLYLNQFSIKARFEFTFFCKLFKSHSIIIERVSSANIVVLNDGINGISLTHDKNNNGRRIDSCGTPQDIDLRHVIDITNTFKSIR